MDTTDTTVRPHITVIDEVERHAERLRAAIERFRQRREESTKVITISFPLMGSSPFYIRLRDHDTHEREHVHEPIAAYMCDRIMGQVKRMYEIVGFSVELSEDDNRRYTLMLSLPEKGRG